MSQLLVQTLITYQIRFTEMQLLHDPISTLIRNTHSRCLYMQSLIYSKTILWSHDVSLNQFLRSILIQFLVHIFCTSKKTFFRTHTFIDFDNFIYLFISLTQIYFDSSKGRIIFILKSSNTMLQRFYNSSSLFHHQQILFTTLVSYVSSIASQF